MNPIKKNILRNPSLWIGASKACLMRRLGRASTVIQTHGVKMRANLQKGKGVWCSIGGLEYEAEMRSVVGLLKPGDVFVDVGANVGIYSLHASVRIGSKGRVIAYEPTPETYSQLVQNMRLNGSGNIVALNIAAGEEEGFLDFAICASNNSNHLILTEEPFGKRQTLDVKRVPVGTIDSMADREHLPAISVLKIDAEGAESQVLAGAKQSIRKWMPTVLFESCCTGSETPDREFLITEGYRLFRLEGSRWTSNVEGHTGNVIGIARRDHAETLGLTW